MARKKSTGSAAPAAEEPTTSAEEIQATAEAQAEGDRALLAALQSRDAGKIAAAIAPEKPKGVTLGDQFLDIAAMLATARKTTRLSEPTLLKAWELLLMWELNNRQSQPTIPTFDYEGDGGGDGTEADDLPTPNEVITGSDDESGQETE